VSSLLAIKLWRDMRASWSRFVLMAIALAVSLTVFGGMLCAWSSIGRETSAAYMSTAPASATIVFDQPIDAGRMAAIAGEARKWPGVLGATGRTQFSTQVEVNGRLRDVPLQIFVAAPDDPMRIVKFDVEYNGSWPPAPGEIVIRRDSLALLGAGVGDRIAIKTPSGEPAALRVAGTVYDPSLAPSPQEQRGHGYLSAASLAISEPARFDQLKLQIADAGAIQPSRDRARVMAVAAEIGAWLEREKGLTVREIQVPKPYAHPHQWQADVLLLSLLAGYTASLLLSAILVATMLNNLFTQQIPQIGIMKAVGAGSGRIGRFYLAMTLLVSTAATLVALGPAILISQNRLERLLGMLGVQAASLAAPSWAYGTIVVIGLGLPPLMALPPLIKASRVTVRAAIDHHGLSARPSAAVGVLAWLSRLRVLDRGLLMALRNSVRRPARFWLSVGLLASAGSVFVAGMSLMSGTQAIDDERSAQRYWDVEVHLTSPAEKEAVATAVERVADVTGIEAWYRTQIGVAGPGQLPFTRTYPDQGHGSVALNTGPAGAALPPPKLLEGRWLNAGETGAVVLNQVTRDNTAPDLGAGDSAQLFIAGKATTWRIAGIVEEREHGGGGVYATAEGFAAATGGPQRVNMLRIVTARHDEQARSTVAAAVEKSLGDAGFDVTVSASVSRSEAASAGHLGPVIMVLLGIALPLGLIGAIGLAATMSANILDRTREFGVMHAIGARPKDVRRIVVAEGLFIALASCLVAAIPALVLTGILGAGLGTLFTSAPLPYRISVLAVGVWIALVLLIAALATEAAATRASRITVREALACL
jgi:putative ABC transport system permease protein